MMPMHADERERFGNVLARLEAIEKRTEKMEDRGFTKSQTWIMVGAVLVAAIPGAVIGGVALFTN